MPTGSDSSLAGGYAPPGPHAPGPRAGGRLGRWCATHHWRVVSAWIAVLVLATVGHNALGGSYTDNFKLSNSPSEQGAALLRGHDPRQGGQGGQLVFTVTSGTLDSHRSAIAKAIENVRTQPHVLSVSSPFRTGTVSADARTAVATVHFDTNPQQLGHTYVGKINAAVAPARSAAVTVNYGGALGKAASTKSKDSRSTLIGLVVALLVLLFGFGSVYAAGLPLLSAGLATVSGLGILGMIAASSTFPTVSPTFAVMMGLGVGIDYALFLSTRYRQSLIDGVGPSDAAGSALATSSRAVLIAATTVILALLSLYVAGIPFIGELGVAGAVAVAVGALAALTLVPALLGLIGDRVDRYQVRAPVAEATSNADGWGRYARRVGAHPWRFLIAGVLLLCVLAIPFFSMRLGHVDAGADPTSDTAKRAYDEVTSAFGPGANGPLTVAVALAPGMSNATLRALEIKLHGALAATPDVADVGPVHPNASRNVLVASVIPRSSPQAAATDSLQTTLRHTTLPAALAGTGAKGYVTGTTSEQLDFRNQITSRLPLIVATVVALAFLLLLVGFRSPVLALKAAALNLLSIGAAYGVIVAVFQWGWGGGLLGVSEKIPIESYVPMLMFAIVFGLSMDYEVFLLSRVREAWLRTGDNHASVAAGLSATARVITCAALIMTGVFLAFLLSTNVVVKMLALGLGASILIDATVIRLVVVPSAMFLLGSYNWWAPGWLDRLLPGGSGSGAYMPGRPAGTSPKRRRAFAGTVSSARDGVPRHMPGLVAAVLGVAVLAAFGLTMLTTSSASTKTKGRKRGLAGITATVAVTKVKNASLSSRLTLAGTVGGNEGTAQITPQTPGTVTSLSISPGQRVSAGQVVARLSDTQGLHAKQAAAQAQLAQAQAALSQAQHPQAQPTSVAQAKAQVAAAQSAVDDADAKRSSDEAARASAQQLAGDATAVADAEGQLGAAQVSLNTVEHPPSASSAVIGADRAAVSTAEQAVNSLEHPQAASASTVAADQAAVRAAQNNLNAADQAASQLTVTAPVAGTVAQILVPVGGYAGPTNPIATLAGSTETVTAQASPSQVAALDGRLGAPATVSLSIPGATRSTSATLTQIAPSVDATTQQTAITFTTKAAFQPDAPVNVVVHMRGPRVPTVPTAAIVDSGGRQGVYVMGGVVDVSALRIKLPSAVPAGTEIGEARFTHVETGVSEHGSTQVLSGVSAGETIVTTGQTDLTAAARSQRVAILPAHASPSANAGRPGSSKSTTNRPATKSGAAGTTLPSRSQVTRLAARGIKVTVVAVHGSTLTVSTPLGNKNFKVRSGSHITHDGRTIPLDQLHAGDVLTVTFTRVNGKLTPATATLR